MARSEYVFHLFGEPFQLPGGWEAARDPRRDGLQLRCAACGGGAQISGEQLYMGKDDRQWVEHILRMTIEKHEHECGKVMRQQAIQAREKGMPVYYNTNTWGNASTSSTTWYEMANTVTRKKFKPTWDAAAAAGPPAKPKTAVERLKASVDQIRVPIPV